MLQKVHKSAIAIEILFLIGQTVTGLSLVDIENIYVHSDEDFDIEKVISSLEDTSLIVKDGDSHTFKLQNFFTKYVEFKMNEDPDNKIKYNSMLISYYHEMILKAKRVVSEGSCHIDELFKMVNKLEKNILKCLYCIFESSKTEPKITTNKTDSLNENLINHDFVVSKYNRSMSKLKQHQKTFYELANEEMEENKNDLRRVSTMKKHNDKKSTIEDSDDKKSNNFLENMCETYSSDSQYLDQIPEVNSKLSSASDFERDSNCDDLEKVCADKNSFEKDAKTRETENLLQPIKKNPKRLMAKMKSQEECKIEEPIGEGGFKNKLFQNMGEIGNKQL